ncbi:TPA: fimbrial protein [Serratia marcescens]
MKRGFIFFLLVIGGGQWASAESFLTNDINYSGSLVDMPPCKINDGNTLEVDFGEVGVNKVGEGNKETPELTRFVSFEIDCQGARPDLFLRYLGVPSAFNQAAVQSTVADLGIQLRRSGLSSSPLPIGEGWLIDGGSAEAIDFSFIAVPVKKPGAELTEGGFEATANLQLEFP